MAPGVADWAGVAFVLAAVSAAACSSKSNDPGGIGGATSAGGSGVATGGSAGATATGGTSGVTGGTVSVGGNGGASGGAGGIDACVGETVTGQRVPLALFLMLDTSGSMLGETEDGSDKWTRVKEGLTSFLNEPDSAGLGVGIQYFPLLKPGAPPSCTTNQQCGENGPCFLKLCWAALEFGVFACEADVDCTLDTGEDLGPCVAFGTCENDGAYVCPNAGGTCTGPDPTVDLGACVPPVSTCIDGYECNVAPYAVPAVPIAELPDATSALVASIEAQVPSGQTPTGPALQGAIDEAREYAAEHPDHTVVALLATDGLPTECEPLEIADIGAVASAAFAGTPSVRTFVIGVFAPDEMDAPGNLDVIARAGGTERAFIVNTSGNVGEQFLAALAEIRGSKLACEFRIPEPTIGETLDYRKVNVDYTHGGSTTRLLQVESAEACGAEDGWYYDDPAAPTRIIVCPASCAAFRNDGSDSVKVELGCTTVVR